MTTSRRFVTSVSIVASKPKRTFKQKSDFAEIMLLLKNAFFFPPDVTEMETFQSALLLLTALASASGEISRP